MHVFEVRSKDSDPGAARVRGRCSELGLKPRRVWTARLFLLDSQYRPRDLERAGKELLSDPVTESWRVGAGAPPAASGSIDVWYRDEVADPAAESVRKGLLDLGLPAPFRVRCGQRTVAQGLSKADAERLARKVLANPVVHRWEIRP